LHDQAAAIDILQSTQLIPLPERIREMQIAAVLRRFKLVEYDADIIARVGELLHCSNCSSVRNISLMPPDPKKQTKKKVLKKPRPAAGYNALAFDVVTGEHTCCTLDHCADYPLERYTILNRTTSCIFVARGEPPLMVAPCCGYLSQLSGITVSDGTFKCLQCAQTREDRLAQVEPDTKVCHFCTKPLRGKHAGNISWIVGEDGQEHRYGFCKLHWRPWTRCRNGVLPMQFLIDNLKNRSGHGLPLPN
jgi:hypothetical protein